MRDDLRPYLGKLVALELCHKADLWLYAQDSVQGAYDGCPTGWLLICAARLDVEPELLAAACQEVVRRCPDAVLADRLAGLTDRRHWERFAASCEDQAWIDAPDVAVAVRECLGLEVLLCQLREF